MTKQSVFEILTKTVLSVFLMLSGISIVEASGKDNPPKDKKKDPETEEVYIVREAEELRDEYLTTYENSDGTYTSFLYASPIRYRNDERQLIDIDESITAKSTKKWVKKFLRKIGKIEI